MEFLQWNDRNGSYTDENCDLEEILRMTYEDAVKYFLGVMNDDFLPRNEELNNRIKVLEEQKAPLIVILSDDVSKEVPYEFIKNILENFSTILTESTSREQKKKLLHMIISEIIVNDLRKIETIKLKINDRLVDYLNKEEAVSVKGAPSSFVLRNVGLNVLNLNIAI